MVQPIAFAHAMRKLRGPLFKAHRDLVHRQLTFLEARRRSAVMLCSARQISLLAASLLLKCPRVLLILRSLLGTLLTAMVVKVKHAARL